jgi:hypothetical protein
MKTLASISHDYIRNRFSYLSNQHQSKLIGRLGSVPGIGAESAMSGRSCLFIASSNLFNECFVSVSSKLSSGLL